MEEWQHIIGVIPLGGGSAFARVWAPRAERIEMKIVSGRERLVALRPDSNGYHTAIIDDAPPGTRYLFRIDGGPERPDPASRHQPEGVHGPSEIVDTAFRWTDTAWLNPPLARHVFYELHVGTFTPQGTFDAVIPRLDALRQLGVTAIELMPIAQFPGSRNWGYDGVNLYAAQSSYGGPAGLSRLVDAAHARGVAVYLDVVYNHLGPEGNYLGDFGPYFTDKYKTPWGPAPNLDGPHADEVRAFFVGNALHWVNEHHIDGLRLDAVHSIIDNSPLHFVEQLASAVHAAADRAGRRVHVIAEDARNDPRIIRPAHLGGVGCDAVWNDDFHHALRTVLTGERKGYYADYGRLEHLARAMRDAFVYTGERSAYRNRRHGRPAPDAPDSRFVVFAQNHDQIGNRALGDRMERLIGFDAAKLAADATLLSPFVPLLFMGEEYAEPAPFQYFVSHSDEALIEAVRKGRSEEFASFDWTGEIPDPQNERTFIRSTLDWSLRTQGRHAPMLAYHAKLLALRAGVPALAFPDRHRQTVTLLERERTLVIHRWTDDGAVLLLLRFQPGDGAVDLTPPPPHAPGAAQWRRLIDSSDPAYGGAGARSPERLEAGALVNIPLVPHAFVVYADQPAPPGDAPRRAEGIA